MFNLVKKDFLTLSKSRSDLIELLLMPFILISILGFALGNLLFGTGSIDTFDVALVNEQTISEDLSRLEERFDEEGFREEVTEELLVTAEQTDPISIFEDMMNSEELQDIMVVREFNSVEEAREALEEDEVAGLITIPEFFSYDVWEAVFFEEESTAALDVVVQNLEQIQGTIIRSVTNNFVEEYNIGASIALATDGQADVEENTNEFGGINQLSTEEPVNAFQYYTIGMGVMFALSTAPALALRSYKEKEQHVFSRIMLSGRKPLTYLSSKMISSTLITFVQLIILFVLSTLIFGTFSGRDTQSWLNILYTTGLYSIFVGSLTSALTSLSLYANNNSTAGFFSSFVSVLAFLGGSFTPVDQFSEALRNLGNWTPNGAAMTSYLQLLQGFSFDEIMPLMVRVIGMTIVMLVVSVMIFPKRRLD